MKVIISDRYQESQETIVLELKSGQYNIYHTLFFLPANQTVYMEAQSGGI